MGHRTFHSQFVNKYISSFLTFYLTYILLLCLCVLSSLSLVQGETAHSRHLTRSFVMLLLLIFLFCTKI